MSLSNPIRKRSKRFNARQRFLVGRTRRGLRYRRLGSRLQLVYEQLESRRLLALDSLGITAPAAIATDGAGSVIGDKNPDTQRAMASTTKIMTNLLAVEMTAPGNPDGLSLSDTVTVGFFPPLMEGSGQGVDAGEQFVLEDSLFMSMLPSDNEATQVIAEHLVANTALGQATVVDALDAFKLLKPATTLENDDVVGQLSFDIDSGVVINDAFAMMMNDRAADLGLTNTRYRTPHGRDPEDVTGVQDYPRPGVNEGHFSTARDLAVLGRFAMLNTTLAGIAGTPGPITVTSVDATPDSRSLTNTNRLIRPGNASQYPGAAGVKTGSTGNAWGVLVSQATILGRTVNAVVMGSDTGDNTQSFGTRIAQRFPDSIDVLNYAFEEEYGFRVDQPNLTVQTLTGVFDASTGIFAVPGTPDDDQIEIRTSATQTEVFINGVSESHPTDAINAIQVDGLGGNDRLIVDFSGGGVLPLDGVIYDGGDETGSPGDDLIVRGGFLPDVVYNATGPGAGTVAVSSSTITFEDLEPVSVAAGIGTLTITVADGMGHEIVLQDIVGINDSQVTIDGGLETIVFTNPMNQLTIDAGDGEDVITVNHLETTFTADILLDGGNDRDTFQVVPSTSAPIFINGGPPVVGDPGVPPGDVLALDLDNVIGADVQEGLSSGVVTSLSHQDVQWINIETVILPDRFELNDSLEQATALGSLQKITLRDLSVHPRLDASAGIPFADVVVVVDESGSMDTEHAFLADFIPDLEQALRGVGIGGMGIFGENQYGLVGFGGDGDPVHLRGHSHLVGGSLFGSAGDFVAAAGTLVITGETEDGYDGIDFALSSYPFRPSGEQLLILVTDEDRDVVNPALNFGNVLASVLSAGATLHGIFDADLEDGGGATALAIDTSGTAYIADGSGGVIKSTGGVATGGFGTTIADYANLVTMAGEGLVGDLNQIRSGGNDAESFSNAMLIGLIEALDIEPLPPDVDFFKYTAQDTGKLIINALFDHELGDLNMRVLDMNGNEIAASTSVTDNEQIVIPVVTQEMYFIEVVGFDGDVNNYDLEIENFPAPVPIAIDLVAASDTGMSDSDDVTSEDEGAITMLADLFDFSAMGIDILTPGEVALSDPGAAVEVFVDGLSVGIATPQAGSNDTLFTFTFDPGDLSEGLNVVTSAVRIFDGKTPQAQGRSQMSEPLLLTMDPTAPATPAAPDLLDSSDSGMEDDDNVTAKMQPAFSGTTEANAKVRVKANGIVVGQGVATSGGVWEITVEPLADGVYDITVEAEDLAGNVSAMSDALQIEIDTLAPNTPFLDLVEADDSGRHNDDNITNVDTPLLSATTHDPNAAIHLSDDNFKYRIYDRLEESAEVLLYDSFAENGDFTDLSQIFTTANLLDGDTILGPLADGIHNLKLEVEDRAGNISHDFLLDVLIDTVAPTGTAILHPDSDTGIWGFPDTMNDGITSDKTPSLVGATEANALVRVDIDGTPAGTTVAVPLDGDDGFPPPPEFDGNYRLDTILNLDDGDHTLEVFFRDVAGNESPADDDATVDITIDTTGPRIMNVTFDGTRSLFEPKPSDEGPDPLTGSIFIHFDELPDAAVVEEEGHYQLVGDANGNIAITAVNVHDVENTVELVFAADLYDDRYTLWVSDSLSDSAGNPLDGESGAQAPFEGNDAPDNTPPIFPTGDGAHGGDFHARFTIDTRPEIATYLGDGTWYVDLNGNGTFDPDNTDPTNRDIVWKFGTKGDLPVTGDWNDDGYDEIGVLGKRGGKDFFFLDLDRNGAFDLAVDAAFEFKMQGAGNGLPVSGDWDGDGSDEVGVFQGNSWFIDDTGTVYTPAVALINPSRINTSMRGLPIAGDWDGDGDDNVGTFEQDQFFLDTDDDFGDSELTVNFPAFDFGGLKPQPVAHDWDQDGDDNIGLFVRRETGNNSGSREAGEWFLDVNTDLSGSGTVDARFEPPPTGQPGVPPVNQDIFYNFGDEREPAALDGLRPLVGNFDPPVGVATTPEQDSLYTNSSNNLDVNDDGYIAPNDALAIINELNAEGAGRLPLPARPDYYLDVNGDGYLAPYDALQVIDFLNEQRPIAEGESASAPVTVAVAAAGDSRAAGHPAGPALYVGALNSSSSSNQHRLQMQNSTGEVSQSPATQMLVPPALEKNVLRRAARDLVLAKSPEELTELESVLDALAHDLASKGIGKI